MLRALLIATLFATSCGKGDAGGGPAIVAGASAGTVVELAGKVTATRDGKTRDLAKGDAVSADDQIATGADGSVAIELLHNHARWSLGASKSGVVKDSAAWALAKSDGSAAPVEGDSSSAGRHNEKSATDTAATAARGDEQKKVDDLSQPLGNASDDAEKAKIRAALEKAKAEQAKQSAEKNAKDGAANRRREPTAKCSPDDPLCIVDAPDATSVIADDAELKACAPSKAKIVFTCKAGTCKVKSATGLDAKQRACVDARIAKMKVPREDAEVILDVP